MNAAEPAVAHDQNMIPWAALGHQGANQGIKGLEYPGRPGHVGRHLPQIPADVRGLEEEHLVGTVEATGQLLLVNPELHGVGAGLQHCQEMCIRDRADPLGQARRAIAALATLPESELLQTSHLYGSRPMGPADQPDYVNAVARLATRLSPLALLDELQRIEQAQGRVRKDERWGPRTLDLDQMCIRDSSDPFRRPRWPPAPGRDVLLPDRSSPRH